MDGMTMMLKNLIGEKRFQEIFATFEVIRVGVGQVMGALNTIHQDQVKAAELAELRHKQILELLAQVGGNAVSDPPHPKASLNGSGETRE